MSLAGQANLFVPIIHVACRPCGGVTGARIALMVLMKKDVHPRLLHVCIRPDCAIIKQDALTPVCSAMAKQTAGTALTNRTDAENNFVHMSTTVATYVITLPKGSSAPALLNRE